MGSQRTCPWGGAPEGKATIRQAVACESERKAPVPSRPRNNVSPPKPEPWPKPPAFQPPNFGLRVLASMSRVAGRGTTVAAVALPGPSERGLGERRTHAVITDAPAIADKVRSVWQATLADGAGVARHADTRTRCACPCGAVRWRVAAGGTKLNAGRSRPGRPSGNSVLCTVSCQPGAGTARLLPKDSS